MSDKIERYQKLSALLHQWLQEDGDEDSAEWEAMQAELPQTRRDSNAETMTRSVVEAGKENAALRERLAAAEAAQQWRPMESAPKDDDGLNVLLLDQNGMVWMGWWSDLAGGWMTCAECGFTVPTHLHPSHWMPLPPAPGGER